MLAIFAFLLTAAAASPLPFGASVSGPGYTGLVAFCHPSASPEGCWQPTASDIASLEAALHRLVRKPPPVGLAGLLRPPHGYVRQYSGSYIGPKRIIVVQGLHRDTPSVKSGNWQYALIAVTGGGGAYFTGHFSVEDGRFTELSPNGPK